MVDQLIFLFLFTSTYVIPTACDGDVSFSSLLLNFTISDKVFLSSPICPSQFPHPLGQVISLAFSNHIHIPQYIHRRHLSS